jgi:5'-deoxynucleotidase YfbR-like HD superfamily hydrolase
VTADLNQIETALRDRIREEEGAHSRRDRASDTLWDHLQRVAILAERLGREEGVDPIACRLAGLFHDAGKFGAGRYHGDDLPEEQRSVEALRDLARESSLATGLVEQVAEAILQLYRDDPEPGDLARVLFDADNLDKLGPLGVANFFVKQGLRGRGISRGTLYGLTVELTYARHAERCLATATGRELARVRAPLTRSALLALLEQLRDDGLHDFAVGQVEFEGLVLDVVSPKACVCGGSVARKLWEVAGIKCSEIHLEHACASCGESSEIKFCRPRLLG